MAIAISCYAQTYTWVGSTGDNLASSWNWNPQPTSTSFGPSTTILFNSANPSQAGLIEDGFLNLQLGGIQYGAGAQSTTIEIAPNNDLTLFGQGITNSSGNIQSLQIDDYANLGFNNGATADNAVINNSGYNGTVEFANDSTGGSATINASGILSGVQFSDNSTAGHATINGTGALSSVIFADTSTAGNATIIASGSNADVEFSSTATAGSANITASGPQSGVAFFGFSTADNSNITVSGTGAYAKFIEGSMAGTAIINASGVGSSAQFSSTASAQDATINTVGAGSYVLVSDSASGGNASLNLSDATSFLDISAVTTGSTTFGSLQGSGSVYLGGNHLVVGGNGMDATFSGSIQDGGQYSGVGGSLTKSGTGTLTLSGVNTYTGGTTIASGSLIVNASSALPSIGAVTLSGAYANLQLNGTPEAPRAIINLNGYESTVDFTNSASAGGASITGNGYGTVVQFSAESNAGNSTIITTGENAFVTFLDSSKAGQANIHANSLNSSVSFYDNASAYNATIEMNGAGSGLFFSESAIADNATITASGSGSTIIFADASSAEHATITASGSNALVRFEGASTGGNANLNLASPTSSLDLSSMPVGYLSLGSLEGQGTVYLGVASLVVGGNDLNMVYSGSMEDGGSAGGTGGSLSKVGSGTLTLTGTSTYTGGTVINAGTLQLGDGVATNGVVGGNITDNATLVFANPTNQSFAGVISGAGSLSKTGAGELFLSGANSYEGGTTVSGSGILVINSDAQLGTVPASPSINITLDNGLLMNSNATTVTLNANRNIYLAAGGGYIDAAYNKTFTVNGQISGVGGLGVAWDCGVLVLGGSNSYSGATTIGTTAIKYWNDSTATPTLRLSNENALPDTNVIFGIGQNTATLDMNGYNAVISGLTGGPNAVVDIKSGNGTSSLTVGDHNTSSTFQGDIQNTSGTLTLVKIGTGTLILSGSNSYAGGTLIDGGTLSLGSSGALGATSTITFAGGTLQYSGSNTTDYSNRFSTSTAEQAYNVDTNGQDVTWATALTGEGSSVTKMGEGTLTLTGTSTYTGATTVSAGTLQISGGGGITQTSSVTVDSVTPATNATLTVDGTVSSVVSTGELAIGAHDNGTMNITNGASVTNSRADIGEYGGSTGTVTVSGSGSTWTNNAFLYLGTLGSQSRGTVNVTNGGTLWVDGILVGCGGTGALNVTNGGIVSTHITNQESFIGDDAGSNGVATVDGTGSTWMAPVNVYVGNFGGATGTLNIQNGGVVTMSGGTANGILTLGNQAGSLGTLNIGNGSEAGTLNTGSVTGGAGTAIINFNHSDPAYIFGPQITGSISVNQIGSGTTILSGICSTYTGATTVSAGTLDISGGSGITQTSSVTVDSVTPATNATLTVDGTGSSVVSIGDLAIGQFHNGTMYITGGASVTNPRADVGYSGGATGTVTVSGSGSTWTNGALYLGTLGSQSRGTVNVTNGGTLWVDGIFVGLDGTGALNVTNGGIVSTNVIIQESFIGDGAGANGTVTVDGTGSIWMAPEDLSAGNYAGATGTLNIQNGGVVTMGGGAADGILTLGYDAGALGTLNIGNGTRAGTLNAGAVTGGGGTAIINFNHSDSGYIFAPQITGSIAVNQIGSGKTILTGTNSYTGGTTIAAGTLSFANASLGTSGMVDFTGDSTLQWYGVNTLDLSNRVKIEDGITATFDTNGNDVTFASTLQTGVNQTAALTKAGAGALTLTATNNYTGGTSIDAGTVSFANGSLGPVGTVDFAGSSTLLWYGTNTQDISGRAKIEDGAVATFDTNGNNITFASALQTGASQTGAVTKAGAGTLVLTATNHYLGGTDINAGTLSFATGALGAAGTVDFTGNSILKWNAINTQDISGRLKIEDGITATVDTNGNNVTFANSVQTGAAQTGALTKVGGGTLTLTAMNNYTGATTIDAGTLNLSNQNAVENSTVTMNGGSLVFDASVIGNAFTVGGLAGALSGPGYDISLQNNAAIPAAVTLTAGGNNANTTYAGDLSGSGSVVKTGAGTLTLTGTNTYGGATMVTHGTLEVSGGGAITQTSIIMMDSVGPATSAVLTVDGTGSSVTSVGSITIGGTGAGTLNIQNGGVVNVGGGGTVTLANGAGSAGTLNIGNGAGAGTLNALAVTGGAGVATINFNHGDSGFIFAPQITGSIAVNQIGSGVTILTGSETYTGATTVSAGTLQISGGALTQTSGITIDSAASATNATLIVDGAGSSVTSKGGLTVGGIGAGTLNIQDGGVVTVVQGILTLANSPGSTGTLNIGNGGGTGTLNASAVNGGAGTAIINFNHNNPGDVFAPQITGNIALNQIGSGTTILTGSDTYTGATTVNAGTLQISGGGALTQTSSVMIDGAALIVDGTGSSVTPVGAVTVGNVSAGTLNITNGGVVNVGSISGTGIVTLAVGARSAGTLNIGNGAGAGTLNAAAVTSGSGVGSVNFNHSDPGAIFAPQISGNISVSQLGGGATILTGLDTYTGATTVSAGTLQVSSGGAITRTSDVLVDSVTPATSATLIIDGSTGRLTSIGNVTVGNIGTGTLTIQNGGVVNVGAGALLLASGTFSAGTLNIGSGGGAGTLNAMGVASGGGTAVINFNHSDPAYIFGPRIAGNIAVNQMGSGATILTASNTYTGATIVSAGTLDLSNQSAAENSTVTINGGSLVFASSVSGDAFTLGGLAASASGTGYDIALADNAAIPTAVALTVGNNNQDTTYAAVLSGPGSLTKIGTGTLTLTGSNTFTGGTNLAAGALSFAYGSLNTTGTVDFIGNSTLQWYGANKQDISGMLKIEDGITASLDTNGNDVTIANAIQIGANHTGALTKIGLGTLTLAGTDSNSYAGATNIAAGTLSFANGSLSATGTIDFIGNSILQWYGANNQDISGKLKIEDGITAGLDTNGNDVTLASAIQTGANQTGAFTKIGLGTLTLTASNDYAGGTNISAGVLAFAAGSLGSTGTVDFIGDSTLRWNVTNTQDISGRLKIEDGITGTVDTNGNDVLFASTIQTGGSQTGALTKAGLGTLTITATNNYMGATLVSAGALLVSGGGAITQTSNVTVNGGILTVDGNASSVSSTGGMTVGDTAAGTLTIQNAGIVYVGGNTLTLANGAGSAGTLNFGDGAGAGTLNAATVNGGAGTAVVNFNHDDAGYVFTPQITGNTSVNQIGGGKTMLTGADTFTGATTVSAGTLQVSAGGTITKTSGITVDGVAPATNAILIVGGTGSVTSTGNLTVGDFGNGTLSITNGGSLTNQETYIGSGTASNGTMTVDGTASTWTIPTGDVNIGYRGAGTLNVTNGGTVLTGDGDHTAFISAGTLYVGYNGSGTVNINSGGSVSNGTGYIGYNAGSTGIVNVDGVRTAWNNDVAGFTDFYVGYSGTGTLNITNGAVVSDLEATIGNSNGSNGTVTVNGANSIWDNTGVLTVGYSFNTIQHINGIATLNIANGGAVTNTSATIGLAGIVNVGGNGANWTCGYPLSKNNDLGVAGSLNINAGGSVSSGDGEVAGVANVGGKGANWSANNLDVYDGGTLNINSGGSVTVSTGDIGFTFTAGTVNVNGGSLTATGGILGSGKDNTLDVKYGGTLNITNGGSVSNGPGSIDSSSKVTVDGQGSTWDNNGFDLSVDGTLNITGGGTVKDVNGTISGGTVIVDGNGSSWTNLALLGSGLAVDTGTLTISNQGVVNPNKEAQGFVISDACIVYVGDDIIGGTATVNLLTGGVLNVISEPGGPYSTLLLGNYFGDTGILNIGNGGAAGTVEAEYVNAGGFGNGIINFDHNESAYKFSPVIGDSETAGSVTVNQIGSGTTILTSSNNYLGATNITAGTLQLSNAYATGLSTVTMNGGTLVFDSSVAGHAFTVIALSATSSGAGYDIALQDNVGNPVALTIAGNYDYYTGTLYIGQTQTVSTTYAGVLSGGGSLTLSGMSEFEHDSVDPGTLTLSGANTYTGPTTLIYGNLVLANRSAVQSSTVTMNGGSLAFDSSVGGHAFTIGGLAATSSGSGYDIALHDNAGAPVALSAGNNNADTAYAGILSGEGSLIKIGSGALTLSAANTYGGGTTVTNGTLILSGANICSGTTSLIGGTLNLSNEKAVQNSTVTLNGGSLVFDSSVSNHAFILGGLENSFSGTGYEITLEDNSATPNPVALSVGNNDENTTFGGVLSGPGSLIKVGGGTLALTWIDNYTGATTVNGGTLAVAGGGTIQQTSSVTIDSLGSATGATLLVDGTIPSNVTSNGNITVGVSGTGVLTIQNFGVVNAGGRFGSGTVTLASGAGSAGTLNIGDGNYTGTLNAELVTGGAGTAIVNFDHDDPVPYVFSPRLAGSIIVNQSGSGITILTQANTHTGATNISAGTLNLSNQAAVEDSTVTMNGGSLVFDSSVYQHAFVFGGLAANASGPGYDIALQDNGTPSNAIALSVGNNNADTTYAGVLSGGGSLTKIGSGTLILTCTNTYTGGTTISAGILQLGDGSAANGSVAGNITDDASLVFADPYDQVYLGIISGGGSVTKLGAGALTLTATSNYTGGTTIAAGTLSFGNRSLGLIGTVDFTGNSTLQWNGNNTRDISARLKIEDAVTATVDTNGNNVTFATALQTGANQTGALTKAGLGTLTLRAANPYKGATTISAGALNLSNQNAVANSTVTMNGGDLSFDSSVSGDAFTLGGLAANASGPGYDIALQDNATTPNPVALTVGNNNADTTYAGVLSGPGSLTKIGTGILTLTGANSYSGGTAITAGTLSFGNGSLSTVGMVDFTGNSTLQWNGVNTQDVSSLLKFEDGITVSIDTNGNNVIFATALDADALVKVGFGTLTLAKSSPYTGGIAISGGGLNLSNQNAVENCTVTMNGGSLSFDSSVSGGGFALGALAASISGSGYDIALQDNAATPNAVSLTVGNNNADTTYAGVLSGSGASITKTGTGAWTLSGASTYTGPTTVAAGALIVSGSLNGTVSVEVSSGALLSVLPGGSVNNAAPVALNGTLTGAGSVGPVTSTGGVIAPGTLGSALTINGSVSLDGTSSFQFTLGTTKASNDLVESGPITLATGATLVLSDPNGVGTTFLNGDTVSLFEGLDGGAPDFAGTTITNLTLPALSNGLSWSTTSLYTEGDLRVVPEANTVYMLLIGAGILLIRPRFRWSGSKAQYSPTHPVVRR